VGTADVEAGNSVRTLRIRTLLGLFVVALVIAWAVARLWDTVGTLPRVPVAAPIVLALIAVALFATALSLRARLRAQRERRPGAKGVDPLAAARAVVFGQASALVASLVVGLYGGAGLYLVMYKLDMEPRQQQAIYAGLAVLAGVAVVAAALFLERVCKLPDDDETPPRPGVHHRSPNAGR
jgi:divalent metal cation (Fe/Co/Zn/Cd) transporter